MHCLESILFDYPRQTYRIFTISALHSRSRNPFYKILLQGQEYDKNRDQGQHGGCHDQPILRGILADEHSQPDLQIIGPKKSFQVATKVKIVRVDNAGFDRGSMILA